MAKKEIKVIDLTTHGNRNLDGSRETAEKLTAGMSGLIDNDIPGMVLALVGHEVHGVIGGDSDELVALFMSVMKHDRTFTQIMGKALGSVAVEDTYGEASAAVAAAAMAMCTKNPRFKETFKKQFKELVGEPID